MENTGVRKQSRWRRIAVFTILAGVAGCNQTTPMIASSNLPADNRSSVARTSAFSQFPDIPVPAGAKMIVDKTLVFGSEPWFGQLALNTTSGPGPMFDFFRQNLPDHQWEEVTSVRAPTSILTYLRDNRVLAIAIQGSTLGGSDVTITVSPRGASRTSSQGLVRQRDLMPVPVTRAP